MARYKVTLMTSSPASGRCARSTSVDDVLQDSPTSSDAAPRHSPSFLRVRSTPKLNTISTTHSSGVRTCANSATNRSRVDARAAEPRRHQQQPSLGSSAFSSFRYLSGNRFVALKTKSVSAHDVSSNRIHFERQTSAAARAGCDVNSGSEDSGGRSGKKTSLLSRFLRQRKISLTSSSFLRASSSSGSSADVTSKKHAKSKKRSISESCHSNHSTVAAAGVPGKCAALKQPDVIAESAHSATNLNKSRSKSAPRITVSVHHEPRNAHVARARTERATPARLRLASHDVSPCRQVSPLLCGSPDVGLRMTSSPLRSYTDALGTLNTPTASDAVTSSTPSSNVTSFQNFFSKKVRSNLQRTKSATKLNRRKASLASATPTPASPPADANTFSPPPPPPSTVMASDNEG